MMSTEIITSERVGIDWLGAFPEHWKAKRIKDVFGEFGSGTTPQASNPRYYENGDIPWLNTSDLNNGVVLDTRVKITKEALEETSLKLYPKGSFAIAMYGQGKTRGTVGLVDFPFTTNQASCVMFKSKRLNLRYLVFWFNYKYESIRAINVGASQPNMNQDFVRFLQIHYPPLEEQTAIAKYLGTKTQAIDKKVSLLEKKIGYYQELRKSLINETVIKGLDKNVKLKDSGIDWIGQIPEHWEVKRVDNLFKERSEKVSDIDFLPLSVSMGGIVPQMEGTAKTQNNDNRKRVRQGDIVLNSRSDRRGASGLSKYDGSVSVISIVITPLSSVNGSYFHYFFKSHAFTEEFYKNGKGIVDDLWSTKYNVMKTFLVSVPPYEEQIKIANYLIEKTSKIDQIITNIQTQIATLKELRKTLINDVVTGKIKVTQD